ncbi:MAG: hypothetical protein FJ090_19900, partial [Deltaproteobacteria bacterium]|nr:hypothetical protein [Deltaproteobacteria bacterium]
MILSTSVLLLAIAACNKEEPAKPIEATPASATSESSGAAAQTLPASTVKSGSSDAWIEGADQLDGIVADEVVDDLVTRAEQRSLARTQEGIDIQSAQYHLAAALVEGGDTPLTNEILVQLATLERQALANEGTFVREFLGAAGASGVSRLQAMDTLDLGIVAPFEAYARKLSQGVRSPPTSKSPQQGAASKKSGSELSEAAAAALAPVLLRARYSLAADGVAVDGSISALKRAVDLIDANDATTTARVSEAIDQTSERLVQFQERKFRTLIELKASIPSAQWFALLEGWSIADFLGSVGGPVGDNVSNTGLSSSMLTPGGATAKGGAGMGAHAGGSQAASGAAGLAMARGTTGTGGGMQQGAMQQGGMQQGGMQQGGMQQGGMQQGGMQQGAMASGTTGARTTGQGGQMGGMQGGQMGGMQGGQMGGMQGSQMGGMQG